MLEHAELADFLGLKGSGVVEPFALSGATWWLEAVSFERGTLDEMRVRVKAGPPRPR